MIEFSQCNDPQLAWIEKVAPGNLRVAITSRHRWWINPLNHNSLRLTPDGIAWAKTQPGVQIYDVTLSRPISGKQMLQLERAFTSPYYITAKTIKVLSEEDAIMLQLHAGDLGTYLDNILM